jgi:iron complex outermembrane receptor protein
VSASGLQLGAGDMTTPVTVLEGDELVRRREATLGETLSSEPGITSSHFGAGASRPIIRGMDGPRVRVLSDGAELHDASTISPDHAVVSEPMLATQIEVLRGPRPWCTATAPWAAWSMCWTARCPRPSRKRLRRQRRAARQHRRS